MFFFSIYSTQLFNCDEIAGLVDFRPDQNGSLRLAIATFVPCLTAAERFLRRLLYCIPGSSEEVNDLVVPIVSNINLVPLVLLQYSLPLRPTQN